MGLIRTLQLSARAAREHAAGTRDRHREPLNADWILQQLLGLQVCTWGYDFEPADIVRCGPMAQSFYRAYGFGTTDKRIPIESALGVLMVSVQVLARRLETVEAELEALRRPADDHQPAQQTLD